MDAQTFALIVGGGPVGLAAAIELAWRAVPAILVNDRLETAQHPKCNNTNARSMEHFRRLGIADELRAEGLPAQIARDARGYVLTGADVGKDPRWSCDRDPYLLETSVPGIFACGDVRASLVKRVASAVGEGSMAIAFVHQYLQHDSGGRKSPG